MIKTYQKYFFLLLVLLVTFAFLGLIVDFMMALFWAIIIAILFHNSYERILAKFPTKPNLATSLTMGLISAIVIIPFTIFTLVVINEANDAYQSLTSDNHSIKDRVENFQQSIPIVESTLKKIGLSSSDIKTRFANLMNQISEFIMGSAVGFTQNIFFFLVNFGLMLYILFFFLRDGKRLVQELMWVIPIADKKEQALLNRFQSVARATVKGSLLVALLQGSLGGFLFYFLGIPSAFLWGVIMTLASLLPIGSSLVWGPYAIYFLIIGNYFNAIILFVVGAGFIGLIDNLLRPHLVGQDTKMPDYIVLISTLGGLTWFGISGFVIGPIIASLFMTCWKMMGTEFGLPHAMVVTERTTEELAKEEEE